MNADEVFGRIICGDQLSVKVIEDSNARKKRYLFIKRHRESKEEKKQEGESRMAKSPSLANDIVGNL